MFYVFCVREGDRGSAEMAREMEIEIEREMAREMEMGREM
jgi:hypothetical protein